MATAESAAAAAQAAAAAAAVHNHERPLFSSIVGPDTVVAAAQAVYERAGLPYPSSFPQPDQIRSDGVGLRPGARLTAATGVNDNHYNHHDDTDYDLGELTDDLNEEDFVEGEEEEEGNAEYSRHEHSNHHQHSPRPETTGPAAATPPASPTSSTASQGTLRSMLTDAKEALEEANNELLCQICFTKRRDALLMPCLHLLYCGVGARLPHHLTVGALFRIIVIPPYQPIPPQLDSNIPYQDCTRDAAFNNQVPVLALCKVGVSFSAGSLSTYLPSIHVTLCLTSIS